MRPSVDRDELPARSRAFAKVNESPSPGRVVKGEVHYFNQSTITFHALTI